MTQIVPKTFGTSFKVDDDARVCTSMHLSLANLTKGKVG